MTQFRVLSDLPGDLPVLRDLDDRAWVSSSGNVAAFLAHPQGPPLTDEASAMANPVTTWRCGHTAGFGDTLQTGRVTAADPLTWGRILPEVPNMRYPGPLSINWSRKQFGLGLLGVLNRSAQAH